jgi:ABC-2 type transport system ATP-binding protein
VRIEHLTKRLRHGVTAVDDLSLTVEPGHVMGLVGPNGSGKTITLKVLLGLVRPTAGQASIFGEQVRPGARVLGRVGALVDGPGFVPYLSGRRNLDLACRQIRLSGGTPDLEAAVLATGLGADIDRPESEYSHGMRYRLALAQALLGSPDLLLLDEPTTGMDPAQVLDVRAAIAERVAGGATVMLSSHHLAEVEEICTHAAVMRRGRLVASGPMEELVGGTDRVRLEVDDTDRAAAVLESLPRVSAVARSGSGAVVAEGDSLRAVDLVDHLDAVGITVTALRPGNFEDTYLALFEGGRDTPQAPFPTP